MAVMDDILLQDNVTDLVRVTLQEITWPQSEPPYDDATLPVLAGSASTVPGENLLDWEIVQDLASPISTLRLSLQEDDDETLVALFDFNKLIKVERKIMSEGYNSGWITIGTFLLSNVPKQITNLPGIWEIEAESPMKMTTRRFWRGKLEPTKIEDSDVELVKEEVEGTDYYLFYDGNTRFDHTINWCPTPRPLITKRGTAFTMPLDEQAVEIRYGEGVVRINRQWLDSRWGSGVNLDCTYSRHTLWEDQFPPNQDRSMNTPSNIIDTMIKYAGFQDDSSSGLFYIDTLEGVTFPTTSFATWKDVGGTFSDITNTLNDVTVGSATILESTADAFYIGLWAQKFPAVHLVLSTVASADLVGVWEYYNGSAWAEITPDSDGTGDWTQTGQVSWFSSDLSSWARNRPDTDMPEAYYVRFRVTTGPTTAPVITGAFPGLPLQCMTPRFTYDDDVKPLDVLDQIVRQYIPSNYFWYADEDGNFIAKHVIQQATPDYTLSTLVSVDSDNRDDRIATHIIYRQRSLDRTNIALKQNGGLAENLSEVLDQNSGIFSGDPFYYWRSSDEIPNLNDGDTSTYIKWRIIEEGNLPDTPHELAKITVAGVGNAADIYEVYFRDSPAYTEDTGGTWAFASGRGNSTGDTDNITDDDENTYESLNRYKNVLTIEYSSAKDIGRIKALMQATASPGLRVGVFLKDQWGNWKYLTDWTADDDKGWVTYDRTLTGVWGVRLWGRPTWSGLNINLYELEIYTYVSAAAEPGTFSGNVSNPTNANDSDEDTYCTLEDEGDNIIMTFDSQVSALETIEFVGTAAGEVVVEYKSDGGSSWAHLGVLPYIPSKQRYFLTDLGLTNVDSVRFFTTEKDKDRELSEIEIFVPTHLEIDHQRMRIRYTTSIGDTPTQLCDEAADFRVGSEGKISFDKSHFGDGIYPAEIYIDVVAWAHQRGTETWGAAISEVRIWTGDVLYGEAKYGTTPPYNESSHLDFAARMGFPTYITEIDEAPGTQATADANALRVLREKVRVYDTLEVIGARPNARIGETVRVKQLVVDVLSLSDRDYIIDSVTHTKDMAGSTLRLVPYV